MVSSILPCNLDGLLHCRGVEPERVEFKATWSPWVTGPQVLRTICAFANDNHNFNGGYLVIGVDERDGRADLPPRGLSEVQINEAQEWICSNCDWIDPIYQPVLSPETVDDRLILVVWAPASEVRPHRAPSTRGGPPRYWIRLGTETINAKQRGDLLRGLVEQAARGPWDDCRNLEAQISDLCEGKVRGDVGSGLLWIASARELYRCLGITLSANDQETHRTVGLLFFSSDPELWYRMAKIEVVQFIANRAGDAQEERTFLGGLVDQVRDSLNYVRNLTTSHVQKQRDRFKAKGWVSYPLLDLRETPVNAVCYRGYDVDQPELTKVQVFPERVEITSFPGPGLGIKPRYLALGT